MPDISFSSTSYNRAIDRITSLEKTAAGWRNVVAKDQIDERTRLKTKLAALKKEKEVQEKAVAANKRRLRGECSRWFPRCEC